MASTSSSDQSISKVSRKNPDSELIVYSGSPRYELYFPDAETAVFSYPVPAGTRMNDLEYSFAGLSISCRLKKTSNPPFLEGKLWSSLKNDADPPLVTFEEQRTGRTLVITFNLPRDAAWPVLIGRPLNADSNSIDPWSAYLLAEVQERGTPSIPGKLENAFKMYQNAARRGVAEAQYRLALLYNDHLECVLVGTSLNHPLANQYFLAVAKVRAIGAHSKLTFAEIGDAQYRVGLAFKAGVGVAAQAETARKWFERARLNGNADANAELQAEEVEVDDGPAAGLGGASPASPIAVVSRGAEIPWWNIALVTGALVLVGGIIYEKYKGSPSD